MSQEHWAVVASYVKDIWAAIGPLIGVLIGVFIANRYQWKHWLLDNKRAGYRTLLTTLTDAASRFVFFYRTTPAVLTGKEQQTTSETARKSANVIYNRLFIADELVRLNVGTRFQNAVDLLKQGQGQTFVKDFDRIIEDIRRSALKEFQE